LPRTSHDTSRLVWFLLVWFLLVWFLLV
jgi:hypothetical protein